MIIRASSVNYTFPNPLYGYKTIIDLAIKWQKLASNNYTRWDYGINYTTRRCQCTAAMNKTDFASFIEVFRDSTKGRGLNIELTPGDGFHPFAPDRGDNGVFKCRLLDLKQNSSIGHPQDTFLADLEFIFNDPLGFPAYTPPTSGIDGQKYQGVLQIGTIQNLRYPPDMQDVDINYAVKTTTTYNGTPAGNDMTAYADTYHATLNLIQNESKSAELINHLVNTVRGNFVYVVPPANAYMFGVENLSTATYNCYMLNEKIEVTHNYYNNFSFPLNLFMRRIGE